VSNLIQRALVIYKPTQQCISFLGELANTLKNQGIEFEVYTVDDVTCLEGKTRVLKEPVDVVFSIGGDGTFLRAARLSLLYTNTLVFPYPCGRRNALYESPERPLSELIREFLRGDYYIELYPVLTIHTGTKRDLFVNEVTIVSSNLGKVSKYNVSVKTPHLSTAFTLEGDGLIISTPVGSSGYSLSARGPLISPLLESVTITPLNPLQIGLPPLVISELSVVNITVLNSSIVYIDGDYAGNLEKNSSIEITPGSKYVKVVRFSPFRDLVRIVLAQRARI
jgi:NAD+ kinase